MRSLPYKRVIAAYSVYTPKQAFTLTVLSARTEAREAAYAISQKGAVRAEFLDCDDSSGRRKLLQDTKIECFLHQQLIFELLTKQQLNYEINTYAHGVLKIEVNGGGTEWKLTRGNDVRTVALNEVDKERVFRMLNVSRR
jgi:hypothetical protein